MDTNDLVLVSYLRQNSRMSLTALSRRTGIPISTIFDKLRKTAGSIIQKHVSLLDFSQLGFATKVSVLLAVAKKDRREVQEYLHKFFHINTLFKINNGYDFMFEAIFHDLKECEDFFDALETKFVVKKKDVYYVVEDLKKESFLSDPDLLAFVCPELMKKPRLIETRYQA